jgi:hypothetical protein
MQRDAVEQFAVGGQGSHNQQTEPRKMGPGGILRNCTFGNCEVAIKMDGGHLEAEGTTFTGNRKNVEATNAVVRMRNTKSE